MRRRRMKGIDAANVKGGGRRGSVVTEEEEGCSCVVAAEV